MTRCTYDTLYIHAYFHCFLTYSCMMHIFTIQYCLTWSSDLTVVVTVHGFGAQRLILQMRRPKQNCLPSDSLTLKVSSSIIGVSFRNHSVIIIYSLLHVYTFYSMSFTIGFKALLDPSQLHKYNPSSLVTDVPLTER